MELEDFRVSPWSEATKRGRRCCLSAVSAGAGRPSSAAAENPKDHCRPPQAENRPERETCQWRLNNQHRVAVAVKPVFLVNCLLIRLLDQLFSAKCASQHKERSPRQMKISKEAIN